MTKMLPTLDLLQRQAKRRLVRRDFLRTTSGIGAGLLGSLALSACSNDDDDDDSMGMEPGAGPNGEDIDLDVLNFALNLEYLEAQFYSYAANGVGLADSMLGGTGTRGTVIEGKMVQFQDPIVAAYAKEIAQDELNHVNFLRAALGSAAVAMPSIDVGFADPMGAFSLAAQAAGLVDAGVAFDPYADDQSFLLGAYIFEDVGVTAYKGASPLITNKTFLEAAAGILAAEAYHAGLVRTVLYSKGMEVQGFTDAISRARNSLDNSTDDDAGVTGTADMSNIVPLDENGIAFSRSPGDVLNIVYLSPGEAMSGGFFPDGVNGTLNTSSAM